MINCPNPTCKTANPEEADVCQVCQSVLPHYYLWGVGALVATLKPGTLLNQRYLLKRDRTFLDTNPGLVPESLPEIPDFLLPYLHLSAYPLHVPRLYSVLRTPDKDYVLMLESSALAMAADSGGGNRQAERLLEPLPRLINSWADAPPLRQLSWLWQISQIWDAFAAEQVAATLLDSTLLRVDGSIVRLLELASPMPLVQAVADASELSVTEDMAQERAIAEPTLADLARSWQPLAESAHQAVRAFLKRLCEKMEQQQLNAEQLSEQLSQAVTTCSQGQAVAYELSVHTDQGPTRKRNEDACFPESGTSLTVSGEQTRQAPQLLIVCDGIGGHQGGDVASKLAIATIQQQLAPTMAVDSPVLTSTELTLAIESAICAANDEISAQNDQAQRQARDRMGTTLVLAYVQGAEVYIAHLGDSRAYRISHQNVQQITLDDDVASRQVRLGGSLYREVLIQPGAGSLIQALGMGPSQSLRPTVQRFVVDETCAFLLCSDGLSDSDRVEQFWQQELSPLVTGDRAAAEVGPRLVDLANQHNGHDNVTVGVLKARVNAASKRTVPRELAAAGTAAPTTIPGETDGSVTAQKTADAAMRGMPKAAMPTTLLMPAPGKAASNPVQPTADNKELSEKKGNGGLKLLAAFVLLLAISGALALVLLPDVRRRILPAANTPDEGLETVPPEGLVVPQDIPVRALPVLDVDAYVRVRQSNVVGIRSEPESSEPESSEPEGSEPEGGAEDDEPSNRDEVSGLAVYATPEIGSSGSSNELLSVVPVGSIVQIQSTRSLDDQAWVRIQFCTPPTGDLPNATVSGETGEPLSESAVDPYNVSESTEEPLRLGLGQLGWIREDRLAVVADPIESPQPSQKGSCER